MNSVPKFPAIWYKWSVVLRNNQLNIFVDELTSIGVKLYVTWSLLHSMEDLWRNYYVIVGLE